MAQTGVSGLVVVDGGKAFWTRSSRLLAKAEALGSTDYKSTVDVDDRSRLAATGWRRSRGHTQPAAQRLHKVGRGLRGHGLIPERASQWDGRINSLKRYVLK